MPWPFFVTPCLSLGVGSGIPKLRNHQNNFSQREAPAKILLERPNLSPGHAQFTQNSENTLLKNDNPNFIKRERNNPHKPS